MPETDRDDVQLLSVLQAAKLTGLARATITRAMDAWSASHGRLGLRWCQPSESRRLIRRQALREWLANQERMAACGV